MYPFHQQVQEFFPDFDYRNPRPDIRDRCDMRRPDNVVGHQQRAFSTYWAVKQCSPVDLGLDLGSPKGLTPYCVSVDVFGDGSVHPFYGGGRYLSDVVGDAADVSRFPKDAWPLVVSNHSLEHIPVRDDEGIVSVLESWFSLLRPGGVLAMIVPDNDHFDVMASDANHYHAWSWADFRPRVLDEVIRRTGAMLVEYNTLQNHFSFNVVLGKP
jgi:SAM-dependent methyltransferase